MKKLILLSTLTMKKLVLILLFIPLLFSFSDKSNSNNKIYNNLVLFRRYEFTLTINGEVHKIKGNAAFGIPTGNGYFPGNPTQVQTPNKCIVTNFGVEKTVSLEINDVTARNYESGQNLAFNIALPNLLLGVNQANISLSGAYFESLSETLGSENFNFQTVKGAPIPVKPGKLQFSGKLPITITELGQAPMIDRMRFYSFGETLKGNYTGTIYLKNTKDGNFTIPVQLSIDFKALRMY